MRKNADDFVSDLHQKTIPFFIQENEELEAYKAEKTGGNSDLLEPWEVGYWAEKLKKDRYDFDDEDLDPTSLFSLYWRVCSIWSPKFLD